MRFRKQMKIILTMSILALMSINTGCSPSIQPSTNDPGMHNHDDETHSHDAYDHPRWLIPSNDGLLSNEQKDNISNSIDISLFDFPEETSYWTATAIFGTLSKAKSQGMLERHGENPGPSYTLPLGIKEHFIDSVEFVFHNKENEPVDSTRICIIFSNTDNNYHAFEADAIISKPDKRKARPPLEWANDAVVQSSENVYSSAESYIVVDTACVLSEKENECSTIYEMLVERTSFEKVKNGEIGGATVCFNSIPQEHYFCDVEESELCLLCGRENTAQTILLLQ